MLPSKIGADSARVVEMAGVTEIRRSSCGLRQSMRFQVCSFFFKGESTMLRRYVVLSCVASLMLAGVAMGTSLTFTDLGAAPGGSGFSYSPTQVNVVGSDVQVVGGFTTGKAFIYKSSTGAVTNLSTTVPALSTARVVAGINASGNMAVSATTSPSYYYTAGGSTTNITNSLGACQLDAIDNYGNVGGFFYNGSAYFPGIAAAGATSPTILPTPSYLAAGIRSMTATSATTGYAVGMANWTDPQFPGPSTETPALWTYSTSPTVTATVTDLGAAVGSALGVDHTTKSIGLVSVNKNGHAAGLLCTVFGPLTKFNVASDTGFLYDAAGTGGLISANLGGMRFATNNPDNLASTAFVGMGRSLNDWDQVVGQTADQTHAAVWSPATITSVPGLVDLNVWAHANTSIPAAWTLVNATAIDNNGDITGWGTNASGTTIQGFLITGFPVGTLIPEPSTLLLAAMGLVGLVAYAWKKHK